MELNKHKQLIDPQEEEIKLPEPPKKKEEAPTNQQEFFALELPTGIRVSLGSCRYNVFELSNLGFDIINNIKPGKTIMRKYIG